MRLGQGWRLAVGEGRGGNTRGDAQGTRRGQDLQGRGLLQTRVTSGPLPRVRGGDGARLGRACGRDRSSAPSACWQTGVGLGGGRGCTNPCGSRRVPGPSQPGWEPGRGPEPCTSPCLLLASGLEGRARAAGVGGVLRGFSLSQARLPPAGWSPGTPFPGAIGLSYPGALCRDGVPVLLPSRHLPARAPAARGSGSGLVWPVVSVRH